MLLSGGSEQHRSEHRVLTRRQYEAIFGAPAGITVPSTRAGVPVPAVPPEDFVPEPAVGEVDVWLPEWQVDADGFDVAVGERIRWSLVEMDQRWVDRPLTEPRSVSLQLDFTAEDRDDADQLTWHDLTGTVTRIDQVSARYVSSRDPAEGGARMPEAGGAQQHSVSSLWDRRPHHGRITSWIVRVQS